MTCSSGPYSWRMNTQPSSAPTASMPSSMPSSTRCGWVARISRSLNVPGSDSSALQITYVGVFSWAATRSHLRPVGKPAPPMPRRPLSFRAAMMQAGFQDRPERGRSLVYDARGSHVAAAQAGALDHLDVRIRAVPLADRGDALVGAAQPAGQVVADAQLGLDRRVGAEVRVEGDQALDLVQRPAHVTGQRDEFLTGQPADSLLDSVQRRDQARARELACACLDARDADPGLSH